MGYACVNLRTKEEIAEDRRWNGQKRWAFDNGVVWRLRGREVGQNGGLGNAGNDDDGGGWRIGAEDRQRIMTERTSVHENFAEQNKKKKNR